MADEVQLDLSPLVDVLESHGWSVSAGEPLLGRRSNPLGAWSISIGPDGRVRFTTTRLTGRPQRRRLQRRYRRYRLLLETHSVLTVTTKIASPEDLPPVLHQLGAFANGHDE